MKIAFLATGDEILSGDTLNSNCHYLSKLLFSEGFTLGLQLACSDLESDIVSCLKFLTKAHDTLIITGGLGPTSDDRTRFALSKFTGLDLIVYERAIEHIKQRLNRANLSVGQANLQQALFPENIMLLPNPNGTAMGGFFRHADVNYVLLPGPPRECLPMFEKHVLPLLNQNLKDDVVTLKWRLFGVAESEIAETLDKKLETIDCETGYRLEVPYVEFKVRCYSDKIAFIKALIEPLVKPFIISPPEKRASDLLKEKIAGLFDEKIMIIDKATGGLLQQSILSRKNHQRICFHLECNASIRFHIEGLNEYWQSIDTTTTKLKIKYQVGNHSGNEEVDIPFRSARVLDYATEWLSFRMTHLINKLHQ